MSFIEKIFGDPGARHIKKKLNPIVGKINSLEPKYEKFSNEELKAMTSRFRSELESGKSFDDILSDAFAVVREASKRVLGMRHFDVQLIGGMVLNQGDIAEMKTGEGKTLVATLSVYLNALSGKGAHVVTVNDYLSRRDAVWMGKVYDFLGLSVGVIQHEKSYMYDSSAKAQVDSEDETKEKGQTEKQKQILPTDSAGQDDVVKDGVLSKTGLVGDDDSTKVGEEEKDEIGASLVVEIDYDYLRSVPRKQAYQADITYGTNNEFGFDYLRDNMVASEDQMVQRDFYYAIVDEVDSILIDEARTPLIISAPDNRPIDLYYKFAEQVKNLKENEDYNVDEKMRSSTLTEDGIKKMEKWLGVENIYTEGGLETVHHIEQALKARTLFEKDRDYVVKEGEIIIVDEFTGRLMHGRRYSEGLHQAIEAKEGVEIKRESRTYATITFQNYFRLYPKLAGMTGTAKTEEEEFRKIYNLDVYDIPTNKPVVRKDLQDKIYKSKKGKYDAVVNEIKKRNKLGQPVLLGTISIEQNEQMSQILEKAGVKHEILNAKNHEREAEIISQAGSKGAVTLATNMAGRGVDIVLGGAPYNRDRAEEVKKAGGLHVLGTERHEARRIDNQLRGRSGRQGDPGSSQFFISVDDDLMRIFGSDRIKSMMNRLGIPEDMPIENKMVSRSIESAQKKVEGNNFDIRKHVVQYDDVMNTHRESIYSRRREILKSTDEKELKEQIFKILEREIEQVVNFHTATESFQNWNLAEIEQTMSTIFPLSIVAKSADGAEKGTTSLNLSKVMCFEKDKDKCRDAQMRTNILDHIIEHVHLVYESMAEAIPNKDEVARIERGVLLNSIDSLWMDHLDTLDNLRTAVGLRGYGQRDPLVEYKRDAYGLFKQLQDSIQNQVAYSIFKVFASRGAIRTSFVAPASQGSEEQKAKALLRTLGSSMSALSGLRFSAPSKTSDQSSPISQFARQGANSSSSYQQSAQFNDRNRFDGKKVGRNDSCPCGSGKKYKKCHGV